MIASNNNITGCITVNETEVAKIWKLLKEVCDPEVPALSIIDLGIVRDVRINPAASNENPEGTVVITPTYSGCPAIDAITIDIRLKLAEHGYKNIKVTSVLSPAWTTDWMSEAGKEKLKAYGIAPPHSTQVDCGNGLFAESEAIQCPLCNSYHTKLISRFGSTACKALYQCEDCQEPFDYFKCH